MGPKPTGVRVRLYRFHAVLPERYPSLLRRCALVPFEISQVLGGLTHAQIPRECLGLHTRCLLSLAVELSLRKRKAVGSIPTAGFLRPVQTVFVLFSSKRKGAKNSPLGLIVRCKCVKWKCANFVLGLAKLWANLKFRR